MYYYFYKHIESNIDICNCLICVVICFVILLIAFCLFVWFWHKYRVQKFYDDIDKKILITKSGSLCNGYGKCVVDNKNQVQETHWWYNATIYHIVIDSFYGWKETKVRNKECPDEFIGGTLKGIKDKLDYIQTLGFNTIMLTPVFQSNAYHGYHTTDYTKIDPHFGTWEDFYELVNAVHEKGMKIICDYVPNHCHKSNILFENARTPSSKTHNWFYFDKKKGNNYTPFLHYSELPKFNLYNRDAAEYMISIAEMMAYSGIDGLRIDHVIGLPFSFLENLMSRIKKINPDIFVFGEATATGVKSTEFDQLYFKTIHIKKLALKYELSQDNLQTQYVNLLDGILDFEFLNIIKSEVEQGNGIMGNLFLLERLKTHFENYSSDFAPVLFLDNQDLNRFMFYCNGDKKLLDEAVMFMCNLPYPICVFYGTEQYMVNSTDLKEGNYADLEVRQPMDWHTVSSVRKIYRRRLNK